jgi:hypothetical protein
MSDAEACVDQLDGGNGFSTGHFGSLMGIQDEDVGQVGTGILEARKYSSDTGRQVGERASKLYINSLHKHQRSCMFHVFWLGLRADGGVLASRRLAAKDSGAPRETIGWANTVGA